MNHRHSVRPVDGGDRSRHPRSGTCHPGNAIARVCLRSGSCARSQHAAAHVAWLCLVIIVRFIVGKRIGPFGTLTAPWQRVVDSIGEDPFLAISAPGHWRRAAFAALGIAAALAILLQNQLLHMYSVPDLGDPLFSIWRIAWVDHQLIANPLYLFDANIFYPERLTLTLSDPVILPALTIAPLLAVGVHPVVAYNVLFLSGFWLSGVATYLLVERLTTRGARHSSLASCACYGPVRTLQSSRAANDARCLGCLRCTRSCVGPGRAVALALTGVAQLSSIYYVFFSAPGSLSTVSGFIAHPSVGSRLVIAAARAAVMVPIARAFCSRQGERAFEVGVYSAVSDYLRAHSVLWRSACSHPRRSERCSQAPPTDARRRRPAPPLGAAAVAPACSNSGRKQIWSSRIHPLVPVGDTSGIRAPARFAAFVGPRLTRGLRAREKFEIALSPSRSRD